MGAVDGGLEGADGLEGPLEAVAGGVRQVGFNYPSLSILIYIGRYKDIIYIYTGERIHTDWAAKAVLVLDGAEGLHVGLLEGHGGGLHLLHGEGRVGVGLLAGGCLALGRVLGLGVTALVAGGLFGVEAEAALMLLGLGLLLMLGRGRWLLLLLLERMPVVGGLRGGHDGDAPTGDGEMAVREVTSWMS